MIIWATLAVIIWLILVFHCAYTLGPFEQLNYAGLMFTLVVLMAFAFVLNNVFSFVWSFF